MVEGWFFLVGLWMIAGWFQDHCALVDGLLWDGSRIVVGWVMDEWRMVGGMLSVD